MKVQVLLPLKLQWTIIVEK